MIISYNAHITIQLYGCHSKSLAYFFIGFLKHAALGFLKHAALISLFSRSHLIPISFPSRSH